MENISIRFKLLFYMIINIVLFSFLLFGSNTFFAEKYYIHNKKDTLIENTQKLIQLVKGKNTELAFDDDELIYSINTLEKSIGGTIYIGTSEGKLYYPSQNSRQAPRMSVFIIDSFPDSDKKTDNRPKPKSNFTFFHKKNVRGWEQYDENSFFFITQDPSFKIDTLRFQTQLDNGLTLLVWVPMAGISENAALSNNFTIIVALITLIITGIWAFFISGRFTRPITEMNKITKKISNLDFSQTLKVNRTDEIGQLSESINQLSYNLDEAICELNDRNKQLERDIYHEKSLDKMRREFVSNVSHELKTPIFLIQGYAEGLKTNIASDNEKKGFYCDVIMEETEKMDSLVKGLLDLSQIEAGTYSINKAGFNISTLIKDVVLKYERILKDKNIYIAIKLQEDLMAYADPIRIEQVIINFMNNAIDHIDEKKEIKLNAALFNNMIRVSIYNSGHQIPIESLDKIWTSFYKVDKARNRELGGTGLGLSIVRAIQEAHNNKYGVINLDNGVEFWFEVAIKAPLKTCTLSE